VQAGAREHPEDLPAQHIDNSSRNSWHRTTKAATSSATR
jgi:hypothetical protein